MVIKTILCSLTGTFMNNNTHTEPTLKADSQEDTCSTVSSGQLREGSAQCTPHHEAARRQWRLSRLRSSLYFNLCKSRAIESRNLSRAEVTDCVAVTNGAGARAGAGPIRLLYTAARRMHCAPCTFAVTLHLIVGRHRAQLSPNKVCGLPFTSAELDSGLDLN